MALGDLSPWPTSSAALLQARTCLKAELGGNVDDNKVDRLGAAAAELVERHAPNAPQAIKNEAVIRAAGWLYGSPSDGTRDEKAGELSASHSPHMLSCLRASGAGALLSPWKIRRAGAIG